MNLPNDRFLDQVATDLTNAQNQQEKLEYLIELGSQLDMTPQLATLPEYLVPGCASHTYARLKVTSNNLDVETYTQAHITRGYLYIISTYLNNHPANEFNRLKAALLDWFASNRLNQASLTNRNNLPTRILTFLESQISQ